jgi:hypothetical protein
MLIDKNDDIRDFPDGAAVPARKHRSNLTVRYHERISADFRRVARSSATGWDAQF